MKPPNPIQISKIKQRLADNDQSALKILYEEFEDKLFHFAFAIIKSHEMAEEIVGDVFIRVWDKRSRISKVENLVWYLYITTRNISYNYHRKYNIRKHVNLDKIALPYYQVDATPEDLAIAGETLQQINTAINELPPKCRLIFKLVKEDGLKYKQVAELLKLTEKTIENQMGIAFKKIHGAINSSGQLQLKIAK